jgi:hypothetical protein
MSLEATHDAVFEKAGGGVLAGVDFKDRSFARAVLTEGAVAGGRAGAPGMPRL